MIEPCLMNLLDGVRIERGAQIDAANFRADMLRQREYIEPDGSDDIHESSSTADGGCSEPIPSVLPAAA
jgi:hypothetical protein